jgi:hypothetical protein
MGTARGLLPWTLLGILALPPAAWGVGNLNLKVQDPGGNPVQTTLTIVPENEPEKPRTVTTGQDGTGTVELPAGTYLVGETSGNYARDSVQRVTVQDGATTTSEFSLFPLAGWMVQSPPGWWSFGIGPFYLGQWGEPSREPGETTTIRTGGANPAVIRDASAGSQFDWRLDVGGLELVTGLPRWDLPKGWPLGHIFTGIHLKGGWADAEIDVETVDNNRFSFEGDGPFFGVGFDVVAVPCDFCGLFVRLSYQFDYSDLDLKVSDCAGGLTLAACSTRTDANYYSHALTGGIGYSPPSWHHRVAFFVGARWLRTDTDLDTTTNLTGPTGATATVQTKLELEQDEWLGVFGVDARLWGPVFLRAEVATNGDTVSTLVKLIWGFGYTRTSVQ